MNKAIQENTAAQAALTAAVAQVVASLNNNEATARAYINSHTKGISKVLGSSFDTYCKYTDEFSLDALSAPIDKIIKSAKDALLAEDDPVATANLVGDIGEVVKSVLELFASSSTTTESVQIVFNQFSANDKNFAVYYGCNSGNAAAQNAFGNKEVTVVANSYIFALVKADEQVELEAVLQQDLDTLLTVNKQYDTAIINAKSQDELNALSFSKNKVEMLRKKIADDLKQEQVKKKTGTS